MPNHRFRNVHYPLGPCESTAQVCCLFSSVRLIVFFIIISFKGRLKSLSWGSSFTFKGNETSENEYAHHHDRTACIIFRTPKPTPQKCRSRALLTAILTGAPYTTTLLRRHTTVFAFSKRISGNVKECI